MPQHDRPSLVDLLTLTLIPGLGPVLISRALRDLGGVTGVLSATPERLRTVQGIGPERARAFQEHRADAARRAAVEAARAQDLGVTLLAMGDPAYPQLLAQMPDAPPVLYVRGRLDALGDDRYPLAIVGSRDCTTYGREQGARFATGLAQAGLTVVSGGARGIDTSAHRAAIVAGGRTTIVLGSGINMPYPPENAGFFEEVVRAGSALVSDFPLDTQPSPDNFPSRNRIIAGLSLGVLVIEAGIKSGSLITARLATEELGREVFALPGRVDSAASAGSLALLKAGGAHLVTSPADILELVRESARHLYAGTHQARFQPPGLLFERPEAEPNGAPVTTARADEPVRAGLTERQRQLLDSLTEPKTIDELVRDLGAEPSTIRADLTIMEVRGCVIREGSRISRRLGRSS